ncbi:MAG: cysteine hydrolase [Clostridiales bacterium]|nr:cysteine hydrolase [Clostridiales bacterium]
MAYNKVLIVVDMQNDFVFDALGSADAQKITGNVKDFISGFDGDIICTYDTHDAEYMNTREGKFLPVPHCIKPEKGWQLIPEVEEAIKGKEVKFFEKPTFGSVELAEYVKGKYSDIYLIGVCTDICVVSNALLIKAFLPEADVHVIESCTAATSLEAQKAAITTMRSCQIDIQ